MNSVQSFRYYDKVKYRYIEEKGLVAITTGYNVTVKKANAPLELDDMEVDFYVGISPNIL